MDNVYKEWIFLFLSMVICSCGMTLFLFQQMKIRDFEKIKNADERLFMTWIVYVLEKGKSDFVKEKLSILGEKYDAASAILYFKSQK